MIVAWVFRAFADSPDLIGFFFRFCVSREVPVLVDDNLAVVPEEIVRGGGTETPSISVLGS